VVCHRLASSSRLTSSLLSSLIGPARGGPCWPITPRHRLKTWRRRQSHSSPSPNGSVMGRCPPHLPGEIELRGIRIWVARPRMPLLWETRPTQSGSPTARLSSRLVFFLALTKQVSDHLSERTNILRLMQKHVCSHFPCRRLYHTSRKHHDRCARAVGHLARPPY